jgi:MoaA/NifB/PqqE/SkfB family radical SAM enzyme
MASPANSSTNAPYRDGIFCTAGVSHFVIAPNGFVYRCMTDLTANWKPLFNIRDGWKGETHLYRCPHKLCQIACDVSWASKWTFDGDNHAIEKISQKALPPDFHNYPTLETLSEMPPHIIWMPTMMCNYSCHYCGCGKGKKQIHETLPMSNPELTIEDWVMGWYMLLESVDYAVVEITGGEPLLSKATIPVLEMITKKYYVTITSNISRNIMELTRSNISLPSKRKRDGLKNVTAGLGMLAASLHPTAAQFNWERYKGAILLLKRNGIEVQTNFVGHPIQLYLAEDYKSWCESNNINFAFSWFIGKDNEGFISGYSDAETGYIYTHFKITQNDVIQNFENAFRGEIELENPVTFTDHNGHFSISGRAKNTSDLSWDTQPNSDDIFIKVGGRIFDMSQESAVLSEYRYNFPKPTIKPGESHVFILNGNLGDYKSGIYKIQVEPVYERKFWFSDIYGCQPKIATLIVQ